MAKLVTREPVTEILLIVTADELTLLMVMVCGALEVFSVCVPKLRVVGEKLMTVPTPLSAVVCGLFGALSTTLRVPVCVPAFVGVNTTLMVQLAFAARLEVQLLVWLYGPVVVMLVMVIATEPVLVRVAACEVLLVPTTCVA